MSTASAAPRAPAPRVSAISLCDNQERGLLRQIEKLTRQIIPFTDRRSPPGSRAALAQAADAGAPRPAEGAFRRGPGGRGGKPGGSSRGGFPPNGALRPARSERFKGG